MIKTGIEKVTEYIFENKNAICTETAREMAKMCLLDELGCCIYGSSVPEAKKILRAMEAVHEKGKCSIWGTTAVFSPETAAFINGSFCHMRELDDVHFDILHTGAVCVPTALAAAQIQNSEIKNLLDAIILGVETAVRIAEGMDFLDHRERGWHGTSTIGTFGAAAAAGYLFGLGEEEMVNALGIAGSRTGGTWAFAADGAMTKRLHPGMAARDGMMAALLAKEGLRGPHYILEARDGGIYRTMSSSWTLDNINSPSKPAIEDIEFKWFASCKSVHSPFSAAEQIYRRNPEKKPEDIQEIHVYVNRSAIEMAGGQYRPDSVISAQISIPYGVALGLWGHTGTAEDYCENCLGREGLRRTASLVKVEESQEMNKLRKNEKRSAAIVEVLWKDGSQDRAFEKAPKGSIFNPLKRQDIIEKFYKLTQPLIDRKDADKLCRFVMEAGESEKISGLTAIMQEVTYGKGRIF